MFNEDVTKYEPEPEGPEATGPRRFWQIIQPEFAALLKLNVLFLLSCVPVVTIPPALMAMHRLVRQMVLGRSPEGYWRTFRSGFRQSYGAFLAWALPMGAAGFGAGFYLQRAGEYPLLLAPFTLCATVFLAATLASAYLYGVLCSGKGLREALRLALMLGIARPLRAVLGALCYYGLPLLGVLFFPFSAVYLLLIGFSLPCLLGSFYTRTVLGKYCGEETDG